MRRYRTVQGVMADLLSEWKHDGYKLPCKGTEHVSVEHQFDLLLCKIFNFEAVRQDENNRTYVYARDVWRYMPQRDFEAFRRISISENGYTLFRAWLATKGIG